MKIILLRHAKTKQSSSTGKDFDRELKPKGKLQCAALTHFLAEYKKETFEIHCSTSKRTRQTLKLIAPSVTISNKHFSDSLYLAGVNDLMQYIAQLPTSAAIPVIIGHNYGISELASYYLDDYILLSTGALVVLDFPFDDPKLLSKGTATLVHHFEPRVSED